MSKITKKGLTLGVMITTIVWSMGLISILPVTAVTVVDGDLIRATTEKAVYLVEGANKRVFPHASVYHSWGYPANYATVKVVSPAVLATYTDGSPVPFRDGALFRGVTQGLHGKATSAVFVVSEGKLRPIKSAAVYQALFKDPKWKLVKWIPDKLLVKFAYPLGDVVESTTAHLDGTIVKYPDAGTLYLIQEGKKRAFTSWSAYTANRYQNVNIVIIPKTETYPDGANITGVEKTLVTPGVGAVVPGIGITVALAAVTPPSQTIIDGQGLANLAAFTITNGDVTERKVTQIKLKRIGVSADNLLPKVYLYEGNNRLTDEASVSGGYITFVNSAGIITLPGNGSKTIMVRADILENISGQTVGVAIMSSADVATTDGAAVTGTFPINGNLMSVAVTELATVALHNDTYPKIVADVDPGTTDYVVWKNTVNVDKRAVNFSLLRLRMIGSVATTDLKNFRLYIDGIQRGTAVESLTADNYLVFDLSTNPVRLETGSRTLEVRADLVGGSSKNFKFSLRQAVDIEVKDSEYNVNVTASRVPADAAVINLNAGNMSVSVVSLPLSEVVKDATSVVLAKYTLTAYGEPIKVETLKVKYTSTSNDGPVGKLRNGTLFANGTQVGSTIDLISASAVTYNLGSSLIVTPGTPKTLEVKADIFDSDGINHISDGDTITVTLVKGANNAQGQTSLTLVSVPNVSKPAGAMTVKTGSLVLAKNTAYGDQKVAKGVTGVKVGSFVVQAGSAEEVTVNSIDVSFCLTCVAGTWDVTKFSNLKISESTAVKTNISATSNLFSTSLVLAPSAQKIIDVFADIASDASENTGFLTKMAINARSKSGISISNSADGQKITVITSQLTHALSPATPEAAIVVGATTVEVARFVFKADIEDYTISEIKVRSVNTAAANSVVNLTIEYPTQTGNATATTAYIESAGQYDATFSGLTMFVPRGNVEKTVIVRATLNAVGSGYGETGDDVKVRLFSYKKQSASVALVEVTGTDTATLIGNTMIVRKSKPTVTPVSLPSTVLTTGTITLAKVKISANSAAPIGWKKIVFAVNGTIGGRVIGSDDVPPVPTTVGIYGINAGAAVADALSIDTVELWDGTTKVPGAPTCFNTSTGSSVEFVADDEQQISGEKIYELRGNVRVVPATGDIVQTRINSGSSSLGIGAYGAIAATAATLVWTDRSADSHSVNTLDWTNDYLIKNIPTTAQALTK